MSLHSECIVVDKTDNRNDFLRLACLAIGIAPASRGGLTDVVIRGDIAKVRGEATRDVYKGTFWFSYRALPDGSREDCVYTIPGIVDDRDPREPFIAGNETEERLKTISESLRAYGPANCSVSFTRKGASSEVRLQRR